MSTLIQVPFHQDTLFLIDRDGEPYVPMRPIVEGIGLAWQVQHRKLTQDAKRWGVTILVIPSEGGHQETVCIPLRRVFGWLMTVSPNKVRPALREKIIAYQAECDDVLWNYWHRQRAALEQHAECWPDNPPSATVDETGEKPFILVIGGQAFTTSIAIADFFEKRHKTTFAMIHRVASEMSPAFRERNFHYSRVMTGGVHFGFRRLGEVYALTRDGFSLLAPAFMNGADRKRYIDFIEAFERAESNPSGFSEFEFVHFLTLTRGRLNKSRNGAAHNTVSINIAKLLEHLWRECPDENRWYEISPAVLARRLDMPSSSLSGALRAVRKWKFLERRPAADRGQPWLCRLLRTELETALKSARKMPMVPDLRVVR